MSDVTRLVLPLPPTVNTYWCHVGRRVLVSAAGRRFRTRCELAAVAQRARRYTGEVSVRATIYMHRAGCDLDKRNGGADRDPAPGAR